MMLLSIGLQACNNEPGAPISIDNPISSGKDSINSGGTGTDTANTAPTAPGQDSAVITKEADISASSDLSASTADSLNLEAERDAKLTGSAVIANRTNASGGKAVGYVGRGGSVEFANVNTAKAGSYSLTVYALNGDKNSRKAQISINGSRLQEVTAAGSGTWRSPKRSSIEFKVPLRAGQNRIEIGNDGAWSPDVDGIRVNLTTTVIAAPTPAPTPAPVPAPTPAATDPVSNNARVVLETNYNTSWDVPSFWYQQKSSPTAIGVVAAPWDASSHALKLTINHGENWNGAGYPRAEVMIDTSKNLSVEYNKHYLFETGFYFPEGSFVSNPNEMLALFQIHHDGGGTIPFAMYLKDGGLKVAVRKSTSSPRWYTALNAVPTGQYLKLKIDYYGSAGDDGSIKIWIDDKLVMDHQGPSAYGGYSRVGYLKTGLYDYFKTVPGNLTVFMSNFRWSEVQ